MIKSSFKKYLIEMPLPKDWDNDRFTDKNSFASQLKYATERAQKIGTGSSRVAFVVPYEGRNTVLKIAKNSKGLAQNEFESQMFSDYYLSGIGITIPMIDYDEKNNQPRWIHMELAQKATESDFKRQFGMNMSDTISAAEIMSGRLANINQRQKDWANNHLTNLMETNEHFSNLVEMISNYDIPTNDFRRLANWGVYKGNLIIIDLGLSNDIWSTLYMNPKKN